MITALSVARAYAQVQKAAGLDDGEAGGAHATAGAAGAGFGDMLKSVMTDAVKSSRHAEAQMVAQVQGKADLVDVATALSAAQTSLQTVMAVRDQVISAYKEILQMPI
jgi:flagellar hook-basal body complex protein FliE